MILFVILNFLTTIIFSDISWDDSSDVKIFTVPKEIKDVSVSNGGCKIDEMVCLKISYLDLVC